MPAPGPVHVRDGKAAAVVPREMSVADLRTAVDDHVNAAHNALRAGLDAVELHGANSYLTHQFLADNTNVRTDAHGGDVAGRIRFPVELITALARAVGPRRPGLRLPDLPARIAAGARSTTRSTPRTSPRTATPDTRTAPP